MGASIIRTGGNIAANPYFPHYWVREGPSPSYQAQAQSLYASLYGGTSALTQIGAGVLNANTDYQLLTRAAGGVQALGGLGAAVAGSTAVVAGGAGSGAGVGIPVAAAGWLLTGYGADQTSAGLSTLLNGTPTATLGGSLLAQTGLSPQVSEMLYGLGGAALTGGAAVGVSALANASLTATNTAANEVSAVVDTRKFSDYIFKLGADHGKNVVFESLGYTADDSPTLSEIWQTQAAQKYASGNFTMGKADQYGQRINIEIALPGKGAASGQTSYLQSGWMIQSDG